MCVPQIPEKRKRKMKFFLTQGGKGSRKHKSGDPESKERREGKKGVPGNHLFGNTWGKDFGGKKKNDPGKRAPAKADPKTPVEESTKEERTLMGGGSTNQ